MTKPLLSPTNDYVFKRLFTEHPRLLRHFLLCVRHWHEDDLRGLVITDPTFRAHKEHDKLPVLDIKMRTTSGISIDMEVQQAFHDFFEPRMAYYTARMYVDRLQSGDSYGKLKPAISIVVTQFSFIKNTACHNCFHLYDEKTRTAYPLCLEIHTLEIPKRLQNFDDPLQLWLHFFAARTEEEFMSLAKIDPIMDEGVTVIRELSADEEARWIADIKEKQRRDLDAFYQTGRLQGRNEGAENRSRDIAKRMLDGGVPLAQIATYTDLTVEQLRELMH